jgi:hypothetical protein
MVAMSVVLGGVTSISVSVAIIGGTERATTNQHNGGSQAGERAKPTALHHAGGGES